MSSNNYRVILYLIYLWINLIERYRCEMVGDGSVQMLHDQSPTLTDVALY